MCSRHFALPLVLVLLTGCGSDRVETVPVSGRVTLDGGDWPKPGALFFQAVTPAPGLPNRPAIANFDTDGRYQVDTFVKGDGLIPGKYLVSVVCWDNPPTPSNPDSKSYVPEKYRMQQTSGLEITIEPGSKPKTFDISIRSEG